MPTQFSMRVFVAFLAAVHFLMAAGTLPAQTIKSQPISKEVAEALQQEKQASDLAAKGHIAEAEALYRQSLATVERSLPNDPILVGSLNNFAQFYRAQQRFPEAEALLGRALPICVALYGDNHTLTATVINNFANSYLADRKYDEAEPLFRRGLAATEALLGPDHYAVAISLDWLAQANFFQKRYAEAEAHLKRGIGIAEKSPGADPLLTVRLLDHLISVVRAQGREEEAAALKARAEAMVKKPSSN